MKNKKKERKKGQRKENLRKIVPFTTKTIAEEGVCNRLPIFTESSFNGEAILDEIE